MSARPGIYLITCLKTGDKYVGSANNPRRRWIEHRYWLKRGKHHSYKFQKCWDENGEDTFQYLILEAVTDITQIYIREQFWINSIRPELNVAQNVDHPSFGLTRTAETSNLIRQAKLEHHARMSPEEKVKLRQKIKDGIKVWRNSLTDEERLEANKRRSHPHTEETKRVLSEKSKANNPRNMLGKHPLPETLEKMRQATQSRWDETKSERDAEKVSKQAEFDAGRPERELARREKLRIANSGKTLTLEQKEHLRQVALAQQADPEYRARHAEGLKAAMNTPEMREKLSKAHKGKVLSEEHRANIGKSGKGKKRSEATKLKMREAQLARWAKRKK